MANTFKSKRSQNVGTSLTKVASYDVPASTQTTVIGLTICNTTANPITVSATVFDGTNDTYLVKDATLIAGSAIVPIGDAQKVVLETGHSIRVKSSAASSVDVTMSILEIA
ncbi:putative structural protein [Rhizobium phage RHph_I1_18]|nr:putative structural protein [Rhizobium phage RHph_I1_18]